MVIASATETFIDFLGFSAATYTGHDGGSYNEDLCVYLLSAADPSATIAKVAETDDFTNLSEASLTAKYVLSDDYHYMCKRFDQANVDTDSDTESDNPVSYDELFNVPVSARMSSSLMYGKMWDACNEATGEFSKSVGAIAKNQKFSTYLKERFLMTNHAAGLTEYASEDYYKFGIDSTSIKHNRSYLAIDDQTKSIYNASYAPFNCMLFCINKNFDSTTANREDNSPKGMKNAIPVCMSCLDGTHIIAAENIELEPNLNGIVTTEI